MTTSFDANIDLSSQEIQSFLFHEDQTQFINAPPQSDGFTHRPIDIRDSGEPAGWNSDVVYIVEETWCLLDRGARSGINKVNIAKSQRVNITVHYWLYMKEMSSIQESYCRDKFNIYDPARDGADINAWISNNLDHSITVDDFSISTVLIIAKIDLPFEVNKSQRDALFELYGQPTGSGARARIDVSDYELKTWGKAHSVDWEKVGEALPPHDEPKPNTNIIRSVGENAASDPTVVKSAVDEITNLLVPVSCGPMKTDTFSLLQMYWLPEIRVRMAPLRIRIGCSDIVIDIPVLEVRSSTMVVYVYYSVPQYTDQFIMRICKACAERAALESAILSIITTQIELAAPAFSELFMGCVKSEIARCVNPGLLGLVEHGPWI